MKTRFTAKALDSMPISRLLRLLDESLDDERYEDAAMMRDAIARNEQANRDIREYQRRRAEGIKQ